MSPYSHQLDNHWESQQTTATPGAQDTLQSNHHWGSQQTTTTLPVQQATLDQYPTESSSTTFDFCNYQSSDNQSLDIPQLSNLRVAFGLSSESPNSDFPSDTFSAPSDSQVVNHWSPDALVYQGQPPYDHRRTCVGNTDASPFQYPSLSTSAKPIPEEPSPCSGNSTDLEGKDSGKSRAAFQCPTCDKSFSHRHRLK